MFPPAVAHVTRTLCVCSTDRLVASQRLDRTCTYQVFASFSRDLQIVHGSDRMVEFSPILLVPALHGTAVGRNAAKAGRHPLHRLWIERQDVIAPTMLDLGAAVGNATRRGERCGDLAWVDRVVEYRRADEDGVGSAAVVVTGRFFGVRQVRKWGGVVERDAIAGRGRTRRCVGRRRSRRRRMRSASVLAVVELHGGAQLTLVGDH